MFRKTLSFLGILLLVGILVSTTGCPKVPYPEKETAEYDQAKSEYERAKADAEAAKQERIAKEKELQKKKAALDELNSKIEALKASQGGM